MNNKQRAAYGAEAIKSGAPDALSNDSKTNAVDTMTNIMHFCNQHGVSFDDIARIANNHFEVETSIGYFFDFANNLTCESCVICLAPIDDLEGIHGLRSHSGCCETCAARMDRKIHRKLIALSGGPAR